MGARPRRRHEEERDPSPSEPRDDGPLPEDYLDEFYALRVDVPCELRGWDLVAWARQHAPGIVKTDEQALASRDRRLARQAVYAARRRDRSRDSRSY